MKKLLGILVLGLLLTSCDSISERWDGYVYPDGSNLSNFRSAGKGFGSLEECRAACISMIRSNNWQNADYECGLNCKYKDGMNICKKTER